MCTPKLVILIVLAMKNDTVNILVHVDLRTLNFLSTHRGVKATNNISSGKERSKD